jgi:hypothetical protein
MRKSTLITLGVLGVAAALGVSCCCCLNLPDDDPQEQQAEQDNNGQDGRPGGGHRTRHTYRWIPIFWGGGGGYVGGPHPTGTGHSSTTSRGGFGGTASAHGGSGA